MGECQHLTKYDDRKNKSVNKIYTQKELVAQRKIWKQGHQKVVFTNGVFDILHRGHVEYLNAAKKMGDILVVGINTNESVQRIKGIKRPIVDEQDRVYIISQLMCVNAVCLFSEDTPLQLITALVPDILVKGADYSLENIVGKNIVEQSGGEVKTITLTPGRSSSNIIEIIVQRFCGDGK